MSQSARLESSAPTWVRYRVVAVCTLMAVLLYLDRNCFSFAEVFIKEDLNFTDDQIGLIMGAFYLSYAIFQVPSGWLSDRYGSRLMLMLYILMWSLFIGLSAIATGFLALVVLRLGMGIGQAGAYPTSAKIISQWMPLTARGSASGIVSTGGRIGGFLAPLVTGYLIYTFVPVSDPSEFVPDDVMDVPGFAVTLADEKLADVPFFQTFRRNLSSQSLEVLDELARNILSIKASAASEDEAAEQIAQLPRVSDEQRHRLVADLNAMLTETALYDEESFSEVTLNEQASGLLESRLEELDTAELARLNRLLIEAQFPDHLRKVHGRGWRQPMLIFGVIGLLVALAFWVIVRDEPRHHPRCNTGEIDKIEHGLLPANERPTKPVGAAPIRELMTNVPMWLSCVVQFTTVIGWIFLVSWLPRYLDTKHGIPLTQRAWMSSIPLFVGWFGMLWGGVLTDRLVHRVGLRWARVLPISLSRFLAMAAYVVCLFEPSPWVAVACFSVVAFATDLGNPAIWAFSQDVGGRHVGSVLGWGNMFGNFGATIAPSLLISLCAVQSGGETIYQWNNAFLVCGGAFLVSGLAALGIDPTTPIVKEDTVPERTQTE